jgi:hypothetical protein
MSFGGRNMKGRRESGGEYESIRKNTERCGKNGRNLSHKGGMKAEELAYIFQEEGNPSF